MSQADLVAVVNRIDSRIRSHPWMDFEIWEYVGGNLIVAGFIDTTVEPDLFIKFDGVFLLSLPAEWNTDTSKRVFQMLEGEEARQWNLRFKVEIGNTLFSFAPEHYSPDFKCVVAAKSVRMSTTLEGLKVPPLRDR
ncbi:hypothetical protein D7X55_31780 [Corallococcus sp. AB049A]|uniref:hypothetical protein n=1 Tax=Corallococcus sp. AB049A TaxID=2316721 RepID=UPI000ED9B505|nr:hypothetical protein [Corallococcus sp. AB049A]RKI52999.1 hypothetical protein D7X55_31780 [Corallococcus sp. AB049A]